MNKESNRMPSFFRLTLFLWLSLMLLFFAWLSQRTDQVKFPGTIDQVSLQRQVNEKLDELSASLSVLVDSSDAVTYPAVYHDPLLSVFLFEEDSLVFWSDNSVVLPDNFAPSSLSEGFVSFPNLYSICRIIQKDAYSAVGLLKLQYHFPFENEFLSNNFLLGGKKLQSFVIAEEESGSLTITDSAGAEIFSLRRTSEEGRGILWYVSLVLYAVGLALFLYFMYELTGFAYTLWNSGWWLVFLFVDLFLLRWLLHHFGLPQVFTDLDIFMSGHTGVLFLESQGQMLISVLFVLFYSISFRRYFRLFPKNLPADIRTTNPRVVDSFSLAGWFIVLLAWFVLFRFWVWIVAKEPGLIELYNILTLDTSELLVLVLMMLSGIAFLAFLFSLSRQTAVIYSLPRLVLIPFVSAIIFFAITRYAGWGPDLISLAFLFMLIISGASVFYRNKNRMSPIGILLVLTLSSVFMVYFLHQSNQRKEAAYQEQVISSLANEHDPIAEMLLQRMDHEIVNDSILRDMIRNPRVPEDVIESYVISNRFGSYWNRYRINVNVCDSVNLMTIAPENVEVRCFPYWENIREKDGQQLGQSHFYYVDTFDGKIWYLGKFPVFTADSSYAYHLFISAESVLVPEGLGYPDVLIAGQHTQDSIWENYSYAKYQNSQLISRSGDYSYASGSELYPATNGSIVHFEEGGYFHWMSMLDEDNLVILSKPKTTIFDHLISFSYLFVIFYLIWLVIAGLIYLPARIREKGLDMKSKIQITMVGILVFSFILIGGGMGYFIVNQYDKTNKSTIYEKIQSVLIEVQHKLELEEDLSADWATGSYPSLQALLVKFSFVFNTDINMYDPGGKLLASSRPEVFRRDLTGKMMDPVAYHHLFQLKKMEFIQRENIGKLGYWSAYVPFYNIQGDLLAYLNLPYFSRQSEIRREVATFLVAILNGYFLLIFLAVVMAVLLGNQITRPLQLLQERFTGMHLGGENTSIAYHRKDEIGSLVKAYNQMLKELEASAEKLARSERETAWREMAKQIAHEIKNPLTPMKLSVQHLKRSWDDKADNWEENLDRVTKTLVEQIDSLTAIANEFSQFAKMPKAKREEIDLITKVENAIALFHESGTSVFQLDIIDDGPFMVYADKEQMLQVLNNLITNAIQSVPQGRKPQVHISLRKSNSSAIISVTDNGSGIPEEMKDKLFQPNFTTKSSGMGLGLAISRNIVENSDGRIWFETGQTGSTFFVELPLV